MYINFKKQYGTRTWIERSMEHEKPRNRPKYMTIWILWKVAFKNNGGNMGYSIRVGQDKTGSLFHTLTPK